MPLSLPFARRSLKAKLISHYLVVLGIGGLVASVVGSYIVISTILAQVRRSVDNIFVTTKTVYEDQLERLRLTVQLAAAGTTIPDHLAARRTGPLLSYLEGIRKDAGFDFLTLTDPDGRVVLRCAQLTPAGDDAGAIPEVASALAGNVAAGTEILTAEMLEREDPRLPGQARIKFVPTPRARPTVKTAITSGMVQVAATPVRGADGRILGALYGGVLLNRNYSIVDRVWELVFSGQRYDGRDIGTVTILQDDVRIATNVRAETGERALGTRVMAEVADSVLDRGVAWRGRSFVVNDWYYSRYEPIRNLNGGTIGILYVGVLERSYTSIRDQLFISFLTLATLTFCVIIATTYYEIHHITRPVGEMVAATRNIAAGRLDVEIDSGSRGDEIALLAESFNTMLKSLRAMRADLEEWGRTLEQKVRERTEELVAMQARVAQSERLASLGMLAAGVAHEINNPLGGILALTSLTLEDLPKDDPNRENLVEVVTQTQRCRDIVKGLLEFSRQSRLGADLVDLNKILDETLALISRQAGFFNVTIVKQYDPALPPVMANRGEMQQVFMNILVNAAQAIEGHGTVTIVTRRAADSVEVLISDTGRGIPPENIGRIFDPFFSTKPSGQGTGLGLSITYGIITSHRGSINVESQVGKGTTFTVRLPAAPVPPRDGAA
jgi:two-component system NtrC family sensor kinase